MASMQSTRILTAHPLPDPSEDIGRWIARLARENDVEFAEMFRYVSALASEDGLVDALSELTGVPVAEVSGLPNEFRLEFWKDPKNCPVEGCGITRRYPSDVLNHLKVMHVQDGKHECPRCDYTTKQRGHLTRHLADRHDVGVRLHPCPHCEREFKQKYRLTRHIARAHGDHPRNHPCPEPNCDYEAGREDRLQQHLAEIHGVRGRTHKCPHCSHRPKRGSHLRRHIAGTHGIGGKWHQCPHCDHGTTRKDNLKVHIRRRHQDDEASS